MPRKTVAELKSVVRVLDREIRIRTAERDRAVEEVAELALKLAALEEERMEVDHARQSLQKKLETEERKIIVLEERLDGKEQQISLLRDVIVEGLTTS